VRDDINYPITYVPACYNINIELAVSSRARYKVEQLFPNKRILNIIKRKNKILFKVPEVKHHCIISVKES
jgi:hypothetical protein